MNFGKILTTLRLEKGIYQKQLADHLRVSIGTISNYEQGIHSPDLRTLCKIADFYDVSVDYLLGRTILRKDPSNFNLPLTEQYTIADFINTTLQLNPENTHALTDYIELLQLKQAYEQKQNSEPKDIEETTEDAGNTENAPESSDEECGE